MFERSGILLSAVSAMSLVMAAPTWAQDATEGTGATTVEEGLALGEPAGETRIPGQTYVRETFNDWSLRCVVVEFSDDRCQLYQLLADEADQPIAEFTLLKLPQGGQAQAAATIIVPLETSLQNQLSIQVDDQPGKRYPFSFCNQVGCYARIGLTPEDIEAYKRGSAAELSIVPMAAPDVRVTVSLSLAGFTAAFAALETAEPGN